MLIIRDSSSSYLTFNNSPFSISQKTFVLTFYFPETVIRCARPTLPVIKPSKTGMPPCHGTRTSTGAPAHAAAESDQTCYKDTPRQAWNFILHQTIKEKNKQNFSILENFSKINY